MSSPPPAPVDILLVDDNSGKLLALETALAPLGQNLVTATSGRDALRQLLTRQFATIILDVNMPGMDGFETAQMIRSRSRSAHTPIIFVSAVNLDGADALRAYSLGAVDYIFAPIIPEVLRAKVAVFVELHRKTEEAKLHAQRLEERTRELERSQRQLRLAERMAMLGTLCAGLGHDMGNLLLPITARLESMGREPLSEAVRQDVDSIRSCVQYLRRLSQGLRMLALDPDSDGSAERLTTLEPWWRDTGPVLRNALPRGVAIEFAAEPGLPPLRIARHQLTQVVFNLVQNAGEAMRSRGSGTVRVSASRGPSDGWVSVSVADDGPGMTPEVLRRCFDPFFTTKSRSLSTGLGLALVHGITEQAGGAVEAVSTVGSGTTFNLRLPIAPALSSPPARRLAAVSLRDARVRGYATSLLEATGFGIVHTPRPDGTEASLWVTDAEAAERDAETFLNADPANRVLVYTPLGGPPPHSGVLAFRVGDGPDGLRDRLREVLAPRETEPAANTAEAPGPFVLAED